MNRYYLQEWISNHRILACRFTDMSAHAVDQWFEETKEAFTVWPNDQPLRLLLDARIAGGIPSPHALYRSHIISQLRPELLGRTAILLEPNTRQALASQLLEAITKNAEHRDRQIFSDENEAISWLLAAGTSAPSL